MPVEGEILHRVWNPSLIILSCVVSLFGSLATVSLAEEHRWLKECETSHTHGHLILLLASISFGGITIWSMHWISIASFHLETAQNEVVTMHVDYAKSVCCCFSAILCVYVGLIIASRDKFFSLARNDRKELLVKEVSSNATLQQIRESGNGRIHYVALVNSIGWIVSGAIISGFGTCSTHYFEMLGIPINAKIQWNGALVFVSCIIPLVGATLAYWIMFRLLTWKPEKELFRIASAILLSSGASGMQYTAEFAANYSYSFSLSSRPGRSLKIDWLAVSGFAVIFSFTMLYCASYSQRTRAHFLFKSTEEIEKALTIVQAEMLIGTPSREESCRLLLKMTGLTEHSLKKARACLEKSGTTIELSPANTSGKKVCA